MIIIVKMVERLVLSSFDLLDVRYERLLLIIEEQICIWVLQRIGVCIWCFGVTTRKITSQEQRNGSHLWMPCCWGCNVAIMLSDRMRGKVHTSSEDSVDTRIVWVRFQGPVCPIFFVVVYIPHKYRTSSSMTTDTLQQLIIDPLKNVAKNDRIIVITGDFNCQLRRNVEGCTGRWSMSKRNEEK